MYSQSIKKKESHSDRHFKGGKIQGRTIVPTIGPRSHPDTPTNSKFQKRSKDKIRKIKILSTFSFKITPQARESKKIGRIGNRTLDLSRAKRTLYP